jgi:hypothetical protein
MADHILSKGFKVATGKAYQRGQVLQLTAAWTVDIATAATQILIGVCIEDVDQVKVDTGKVVIGADVIGITRCIASAPITAGTPVTATAGGKIVGMTKAAAGAQPARQLGIAMGAAAANNDEIDVLLTPGGQF